MCNWAISRHIFVFASLGLKFRAKSLSLNVPESLSVVYVQFKNCIEFQ
jgi:hypothetical protein